MCTGWRLRYLRARSSDSRRGTYRLHAEMYDAARAPGSARDPARRTTPGRRSRREEGSRDRRGSPRRGEKLHLPRGEPTRRSALPRPATRRCRRQTPARVEARSRASAKGAPSAARSSAQTGDTRAFKREGGAPPHHCGWPRTWQTAPRRRFQLQAGVLRRGARDRAADLPRNPPSKSAASRGRRRPVAVGTMQPRA